MKNFYVWTGTKLLAVDNFYLNQFRHAFVYEPQALEHMRWNVLFKGKLKARAKKYMPKEFLMHLLLMGVPT